MRNLIRYFVTHWQAARNSLAQFSHSPFNSVVTCLIISIALAFPTALFVLLKNMDWMNNHLRDSTDFTIYLKKNLTDAQVNQFYQSILTKPEIASAKIISPTEGLKELQKQAGFLDATTELQANPLPYAIVISPRANFQAPELLEQLTAQFNNMPEVDQLQFDMFWVKRLQAFVLLAHRFIYTLASFLGFAVLLIVNHSIRTVTEHNRKEIEIFRLIGGTRGYIRRPFLYTGMIYGLLGGIIAWQLVDVFMLWLNSPLSNLFNFYDQTFHWASLSYPETLALLGISILLGWAGSWLAVARHFKEERTLRMQA